MVRAAASVADPVEDSDTGVQITRGVVQPCCISCKKELQETDEVAAAEQAGTPAKLLTKHSRVAAAAEAKAEDAAYC